MAGALHAPIHETPPLQKYAGRVFQPSERGFAVISVLLAQRQPGAAAKFLLPSCTYVIINVHCTPRLQCFFDDAIPAGITRVHARIFRLQTAHRDYNPLPKMDAPSDIHLQLVALLAREGAPYRLVEHEPEGRTEWIARIRGNRPEQAIKSIVVQLRLSKKENRYCLANVPGHRRVDLEAIRLHFDAAGIGIANREKAEALTGCVIGAIPPFSFNERLFVLADPLIAENEEVVFNAGRLDRSIFMRSGDYMRIARPELFSFSIQP